MRGLEALSGFWEHARPISRTPVHAARPRLALQPAVQHPVATPSAELRFILFAGKGGVGKTTLACVTAIRLARDFPEKQVLLFSTDPAHSLSACLQMEIGPRPTLLFPGLTAVEIDAQAEFGKLKARYAEDLEQFLDSISRGFDLTFDRVVLERLMDLAPPGLDEIMALTRIMEFLARASYDSLHPGLCADRPSDPAAGTSGSHQRLAQDILQPLYQVRAGTAIARICR